MHAIAIRRIVWRAARDPGQVAQELLAWKQADASPSTDGRSRENDGTMLSSLYAYLPQDRLRALARGESLPDRAEGSALFADISGFTFLTETLARALGPRRGAEELTRQLNRVYDALIAEVEHHDGSVIGFAGDAVTCWFDARYRAPDALHAGAPVRATACALAMQAAMRTFAQVPIPTGKRVSLAMKAAVASGTARRFVVGDGSIQLLEVLAGATLDRMAAAERLAAKGEVLVDETTCSHVENAAKVREWRTNEPGERFAVISAWRSPVAGMRLAAAGANAEDQACAPRVAAEVQYPDLEPATLRRWLLPAVYERLQAGAGEFFTELRPAVALFIKFTGIDYDADARAGDRLDAYIQWVQRVLTRYAGVLFDVTMGDKGSYMYAAFGALVAHEDDVRRAAGAALELRAPPAELSFIQSVRIGLSQGVMRVGAYGGATRRTYGSLGDDVNLAARLMQAAAPGQVMVSASVYAHVKNAFACRAEPDLYARGKSEPVAVWSLLGIGYGASAELHEPAYALPLVGREPELALVADKFAQVLQGHGQIVGITADAGMGKSRLVAEIVRLAAETGHLAHTRIAIYAGACQSFGTNMAYLVWRDIWRGLFGLDPAAPVPDQIRSVERILAAVDPLLVQRAPLLSLVLGIPIPDNDLTRTFDARLRKESLEALLVDCLKVQAARAPMVLVLEDAHWLDSLSHDLLAAVGRAMVNLPLLVILAYRPPELARLRVDRVMGLPHATTIRLNELTPLEAEQLIDLKLSQAGASRGAASLQPVKHRIMARAQGNPFFIEEIINDLRDRAPDWSNPQAIGQLDWPDSLHTLILSRIDRLTTREKLTLKVASIIGRVFRVAWLLGYYPALGDLQSVKADLGRLHRLEITLLDTPEPDLAYVFKHIVTQEVTYESLPYATRAQLHEQLAAWLERDLAAPPPELLAFHYDRSENMPKRREYLRKAGQAAQQHFANDAALDWYGRLLPLLEDATERTEIHMQRGSVLELMGRWDGAEGDYRAALELAGRDAAMTASAQCALGKLCRQRGDFAAALDWLARAQAGYAALADRAGLAKALIETGAVLWRQGEYDQARQVSLAGMEHARMAGDPANMARALNNLGTIAYDQHGDFATARAEYAASLALRREIGDKGGTAMSLSNLGSIAFAQGDAATARALFEESLAIKREIGDKRGIASSLTNLGVAAHAQGDDLAARALLDDSLALRREMGDKRGIAVSLENLGLVALARQEDDRARALFAESLALSHQIGNKLYMAYDLTGLACLAGDAQAAVQLAAAAAALMAGIGATWETEEKRLHEHTLAIARTVLGEEVFRIAWAAGQQMTMEEALALAWRPGPLCGGS